MERQRNQIEDFSFSEVFQLLKHFVDVLWRGKVWILSISISLALIFGTIRYLKPTEYKATLTFMLNEDEGGGFSAANSILGQFGISGGTDYNLEKVIKLSKSRKIILPALMDSISLDGKKDLLINIFIDVNDYVEKHWTKYDKLEGFSVFEHNNLENFTTQELLAFRIIFDNISNSKNFYYVGVDETTGIFEIEINSLSDVLSKELCEKLYVNLSTFYINQSTTQSKITLSQLEDKKNKVKQDLEQKELEYAQILDSSQSIFLRENKIREQRIKREINILSIQYGELIKSFETADFLLKTTTPTFQLIDSPIFPLKQSNKALLKICFLAFISGVFVVSFFLILFKSNS